MAVQSELRDFLRAARGRVRPEDVALVDATAPGRRVAGLRREEVARLAGVSVDYYARLEQGRAGQVSASVRSAVARALRLTPAEQEYFFALTGDAPVVAGTDRVPQRVRPGVLRTVEAMTDVPAMVLGSGLQVLAQNRLAKLLFFDAEALPYRERNLARWTFLDPEARVRHRAWATAAAGTAATIRVDTARDPDDRWLTELVGELTVESPEFAAMWAEHRVHVCAGDTVELHHPVVGDLALEYEAYDVADAPGQRVKVYTAEPGSPSADSLTLLGLSA